jgi:hypothetical protein
MRNVLPEPWPLLRKKYRTIGRMCEAMGVSSRSFFNWVQGYRKPNSAALRLLTLFLEAHGLPPFVPPPHKPKRPSYHPDHESAFEPTSDDTRTMPMEMNDENI